MLFINIYWHFYSSKHTATDHGSTGSTRNEQAGGSTNARTAADASRGETTQVVLTSLNTRSTHGRFVCIFPKYRVHCQKHRRPTWATAN